LNVPGEDDFTVVLLVSGGPDHGQIDVSMDGKPVGRVDAERPAFTPWLGAELGRIRVSGGRHVLGLKLGRKPGVGPPAGGPAPLAAGLVAVQLRPHSRLIDQWSVIGNWPCPKDTGWQEVHEPEKSQDLAAVYRLPGGQEARWREHKGDFVGLSGGDWMVAYGLTYVHSLDDRSVALFITKDDGLKVWVNDAVVFDRNTWSHAYADQFHATARLTKGWNKVLVKCANHSGAWAFALRPGDPDRQLKFARQPQP
jgi:hypothetical protein